MKQKLLRAGALALTLLTIASLPIGCTGKAKPVVTDALQMNDAAYTVGVPSGATAVNAVESALPNAKMKYYSSLPDAYLAVQQGKVDAFAFDRYLLGFAIANGLTGTKVLPGDIGTADDIAIGISRKTEIPDLKQKINDCLAALKADGTLDEMFQRWVVNAADIMPEIQKAEHPTMTLKVGTSGLVQPFSYYKGNELNGYDLELSARLALALNAELEIKTYDYDGFPAALESGAIDCVLANLNATPERRETMDFSDPLFQTHTALLVRDDSAAAQAPAAAALETARYGVMTGSVAEIYLTKTYPNANISTYSAIPDAFLALTNGKLDYVMTAYTTAATAIRNNDALYIYQNDVEKDQIACGVAKDNAVLREKIDAVLTTFKEDGTLEQIVANWTTPGQAYVLDDVPAASGKNGVLRVAVNADREPMCFVLDGTYRGLDCELARRIAHALDMKVEFQNMQFTGLIAALQSGKADAILSNLVVTDERAEQIDFTQSYFDNPQVLVSRKMAAPASGSGSSSSGDSRVPVETARVGVMTGSTNEFYAKEHYPDANIQSFNNYVDSTAALDAGKLDYAMMDYTSALRFIRSYHGLKIASGALTDEKVCLGISKSQPALAEKVSTVVDKYLADGTMDEIISHWIKPDGSNYDVVETPKLDGAPKIKVAIIASREPTTFLLDGKYAGLDIELIDRVLYESGYQAEYLDMDLAAVVASVDSNKAEMTLGMYSTPERAEKLLFTAPYFANPQVLISRKDTVTDTAVPQYTALSQLSGKVVACQTGSVADILVGSAVKNVTFSYFNNRTDQLAALENGKVEAVPLDEPVARLAVAQNLDFALLSDRIVEDHYGVALQKDSPLTAQVNDAIAQLKADGTLDAMKKKWTGSDESVKTLPQIDYPGANGTLRVVHDTAGEPMEYIGASGKAVGYDLELMLRIGQILDQKIEFTGADFSALIPMLQSGKADAAVGCLSITDERKQVVDMSDSYYDGGLYFVVRKAVEAQTAANMQPEMSFWDGLKASFTRTFLTENRWKLVLDGLEVTVLISICSGLLGSLMGFGICMLRRSKKRFASIPAACFIRLIQGTPIVVLLMILYYIIFGKVDISAVLVAIFGFAVNFGVYVSEMMRTGIDAVDQGQIEAAHALGFTKAKTFWKITFPQAARHFLPVFKGEFISMVKMTSVVGYIAIQDLTKVSDIIRSRTLEAFFPLIATAVIYFLVANILTLLLSRLEISLDPKRRKRAVKGVVMK